MEQKSFVPNDIPEHIDCCYYCGICIVEICSITEVSVKLHTSSGPIGILVSKMSIIIRIVPHDAAITRTFLESSHKDKLIYMMSTCNRDVINKLGKFVLLCMQQAGNM